MTQSEDQNDRPEKQNQYQVQWNLDPWTWLPIMRSSLWNLLEDVNEALQSPKYGLG